jgi:hypothetical protein
MPGKNRKSSKKKTNKKIIDNNVLTPVKEMDFLESDPSLRNQNYACISFISPEDVIKKKEAYFFETYIKDFSKSMNDFFDNLSKKYGNEVGTIASIKERFIHVFETDKINDDYYNYYNMHSEELEKAYHEANKLQTTIRGVKLRGNFDSKEEAELRCKVIKRFDDKSHVFVCQVGCWCPWSPNPDDIEDAEYAETQLNTLVKNYKKNQEEKDLFYEERKRELQKLQKKEKNNEDAENVNDVSNVNDVPNVNDVSNSNEVVNGNDVPNVNDVSNVNDVPNVNDVLNGNEVVNGNDVPNVNDVSNVNDVPNVNDILNGNEVVNGNDVPNVNDVSNCNQVVNNHDVSNSNDVANGNQVILPNNSALSNDNVEFNVDFNDFTHDVDNDFITFKLDDCNNLSEITDIVDNDQISASNTVNTWKSRLEDIDPWSQRHLEKNISWK